MKAFDSVPHRRLLLKLSACGVQERVLNWITDFLANRKQRVVVNGVKSSEANVTSGIPQGSVLGPLLFVIYINDLPRDLKTTAKMFADDTKLYTRSDTETGPKDLQDDLDTLQDWSEKWLLRFHPQKCGVMKLGKPSQQEYFMGPPETQDDNSARTKLGVISKEKDLGVTIDDRLKFKEHVALSTAKANRVVGVIRRTFDHLTEKMFVQLFKSLVRPLLEYGHSIWQPDQIGLCREIERVQKRATKLLSHLKEKPYSERLKALKLPSLEHRRKRGDMIEVFKYVNNFYDVKSPKLSKAKNEQLRGNSKKLEKTRCNTSIRLNYFSNRCINDWNNLPDSVVNAETINSFKNRLDEHWKNLPTIYNPTCQ